MKLKGLGRLHKMLAVNYTNPTPYAYSKTLVMMPVPTEFIQISHVRGVNHAKLTRFVTLAKCESMNIVRLDPPSDIEI